MIKNFKSNQNFDLLDLEDHNSRDKRFVPLKNLQSIDIEDMVLKKKLGSNESH